MSKHFAADQMVKHPQFLFFFLQHRWFKLLPVLGAESLDVQKNASQCTIKLDIEQVLELGKGTKGGALAAASLAHSVLNTTFRFVATVSKTSAK
jgi:hypothetical protein